MVSSIRNFFLALVISLLVFGISAYFIVQAVNKNMNIINPDPTEPTTGANVAGTTEPATDENGKLIKVDETEFNVLILGIDKGNSQTDEKIEADTIILLNLNAKTKTIMISSLPCNLKTEVGGYVLRLGAVYGECDSDKMIETVKAYTGIEADYLCVLDYQSIQKVFDVLGDVEFNIPMNMSYKPIPYYYDPSTTEADTTEPVTTKPAPTKKPENESTEETTIDYENETINLKSGKQMINGEMAVQLLRFADYSNGNSDRIITQIDFIKEFLRQKITFENFDKADEIYTKIKESIVYTNMDEKDFDIYKETIFKISEFTLLPPVEYPGVPRTENGVQFFLPANPLSSAINRYMDFRKEPKTP